MACIGSAFFFRLSLCVTRASARHKNVTPEIIAFRFVNHSGI